MEYPVNEEEGYTIDFSSEDAGELLKMLSSQIEIYPRRIALDLSTSESEVRRAISGGSNALFILSQYLSLHSNIECEVYIKIRKNETS